MTTTTKAIEILAESVSAHMTTDEIKSLIRSIGLTKDNHLRIFRCGLLDVLGFREGEDEFDDLCDELFAVVDTTDEVRRFEILDAQSFPEGSKVRDMLHGETVTIVSEPWLESRGPTRGFLVDVLTRRRGVEPVRIDFLVEAD